MTRPVPEPILHVAADWWLRLRADDASERTTGQWLDWVERDPVHLDAFEQVAALAERLASAGAVTRDRLVAEFVPARVGPRWRIPAAVTAAAAVLLALGLAYLARTGAPGPMQRYASGVGGRQAIRLADGSQVDVGAATTLRARVGRAGRSVELDRGEAFFRVVHDARRPFVVQAGAVTIRDIGTAFDVRRTGDRVTVAVAEGRVRVGDGRGGSLEAGAGQAIRFDPAHPAMQVLSIDPARVAGWRDGRLDFDNEPLPVVVANINRYRADPLRVGDARLAALTFTGSVRTDAIDEWLRTLPQVLPVRVRAGAGATVLESAGAPPPR
ncbi:MAG: FecR domain-containing protein [Xanthomonadaceae bacterium]|nr:FecR domain-containing protein [Xanthomonadaceae bacterium]MDE1965349.1 FecR domain-containing protein [Xanthomonadaceae bacterium]